LFFSLLCFFTLLHASSLLFLALVFSLACVLLLFSVLVFSCPLLRFPPSAVLHCSVPRLTWVLSSSFLCGDAGLPFSCFSVAMCVWLLAEPEPAVELDVVRIGLEVNVLPRSGSISVFDHAPGDPATPELAEGPHVNQVRVAHPIGRDARRANNAAIRIASDDRRGAVLEGRAKLFGRSTVVEAIGGEQKLQLRPVDIRQVTLKTVSVIRAGPRSARR
jgi:hypothetical protein